MDLETELALFEEATRYAYGGPVVHTVGTVFAAYLFFSGFYCFYKGMQVDRDG